MVLRREFYQSQADGSSTLVEVVAIDRNGTGNPLFTRERPPGTVVEQREADPQETAQLLAEEDAQRTDAARTRLAAFDPDNATAEQVAGCLADLLRILGIG